MNNLFLYLSISFFVIGLLTAFFSTVFLSLREDDYEQLSIDNPKFLKRIKYLNFNHSASKYPFISIEFILYLFASALLNQHLFSLEISQAAIYGILAIIFILLLVLRTMFYAFGSNISISFAIKFSFILQILMFLSVPFDKFLSWLSTSISKKTIQESSFEELSALVDTVCEENDTDNIGEYTLLKNVINFKDVYVSDIMTPRTVIFSCNSENIINDVVNLPETQMYSRLPLKNGETMDNGVMGYALTKDIYRAALQGKGKMKLKQLSRKIEYIPENSSLEKALDLLLKKRQMMLLVVDEYGGIEGLLTMEDIIETILGAEILDEGDKFADMRELAKQRRDKRIASASQKSE